MVQIYEKLKHEIFLHSVTCGISSDEVSLAKSLVQNKCSNKSLFICEGLWATEKLIEKNIKVSHFFYNNENLENNKISEENLTKIAKLTKSKTVKSCG